MHVRTGLLFMGALCASACATRTPTSPAVTHSFTLQHQIAADAQDQRPLPPPHDPARPQNNEPPRSGDFYIHLEPEVTGEETIQGSSCLGLTWIQSLRTMLRTDKFMATLTASTAASNATSSPSAASLDALQRPIPLFMVYYNERPGPNEPRCMLRQFDRPLTPALRHNGNIRFNIDTEFIVTNTPDYNVFSNIASVVPQFLEWVEVGGITSEQIDLAGRSLDREVSALRGGRQHEIDQFSLSLNRGEWAQDISASYQGATQGNERSLALGVGLRIVARRSILRDELAAYPDLANILPLRPPLAPEQSDQISGQAKSLNRLFDDNRFDLTNGNRPSAQWSGVEWRDFRENCGDMRAALQSTYGFSSTDGDLAALSLVVSNAPEYFRVEGRQDSPCFTLTEARELLDLMNAGAADRERIEPPRAEPMSVSRNLEVDAILDWINNTFYDNERAAVPSEEVFVRAWTERLGAGLDTFSVVDERAEQATTIRGQAALAFLSKFRGSHISEYRANRTRSLGMVNGNLSVVFEGRAQGQAGIIVESEPGSGAMNRAYTRVRILPSATDAIAVVFSPRA